MCCGGAGYVHRLPMCRRYLGHALIDAYRVIHTCKEISVDDDASVVMLVMTASLRPEQSLKRKAERLLAGSHLMSAHGAKRPRRGGSEKLSLVRAVLGFRGDRSSSSAELGLRAESHVVVAVYG